MARPHKKGLDYFPMDVDYFEDDKIIALSMKHGPLGVMIYQWLLCETYKNGYYYEFATDCLLTAKIIRSIGNRWIRDTKIVEQVILYCAEINLIDAELVRQNVITSTSIQRRYLAATERRQSSYGGKYWLVDKNGELLESAPIKSINVCDNGVNVYNNSGNVNIKYTKKSKVKKSKVNERRKVRRPAVGSVFTSFKERVCKIVEIYNKVCTCFKKTTRITKTHINLLKDGLKDYTILDYIEVFEKAAKNEFLNSANKGWVVTFDWLIKPSNMAKILNGTYDKWDDNKKVLPDTASEINSSFDTDEFFLLSWRRSLRAVYDDEEKVNEEIRNYCEENKINVPDWAYCQ